VLTPQYLQPEVFSRRCGSRPSSSDCGSSCCCCRRCCLFMR